MAATADLAVGYVLAWLGGVGSDVGEGLRHDIASATTLALQGLYEDVKGRVCRTRPGRRAIGRLEEAPGDIVAAEQLHDVLSDELDADVSGDFARSLDASMAVLAEDPRVASLLRGIAAADVVRGWQIGAFVRGGVAQDSAIVGEAHAGTVEAEGQNIGIYVDGEG
jgi:hypothetical protein